jgi:protein-tyrosine-phosphatase
LLKILFVCTGNTCRSPMAEALFNNAVLHSSLPYRVVSSSSGLHAVRGDRVSPEVLSLLSQEGLDLSEHSARQLNQTLVEDSDLILVMAGTHKHELCSIFPDAVNKTYLLKEFAGEDHAPGDITDPLGQGLEKYQQVLEEIRQCIKKIISKMEDSLHESGSG